MARKVIDGLFDRTTVSNMNENFEYLFNATGQFNNVGVLLANKGSVYPMLNTEPNSRPFSVLDNSILDIGVHYAEIGAQYKIYHISNNNTRFSPTRTFIGIMKSIDGGNKWTVLMNNDHTNLPNGQTGVQSHVFSDPSLKEVISITIDWDEVPEGGHSSATTDDKYIISPTKYFFRDSVGNVGSVPTGRVALSRDSEQEFTVNLGDSVIKFGKLGINQLTHPINITHSTSNVINTDWISPYQAGTVTNGMMDNNHASVSGNHGTDGGSGFATAYTASTTIKDSNGNIIPLQSRRVDDVKITLTVENMITTLSNINLVNGERKTIDFKEIVTYTFEYNHMHVHTKITAINPIYIHWYFGLQMTRSDYRKDAYFTYDSSSSNLYQQSSVKLNSGTKRDSPNISRVTMRGDNGDVAHIYIDKDFGIGYSHIGESDVIAYLREKWLKLYFHLVKTGTPLILSQGESSEYRGGYIFTKNNANKATNVSMFVENGVLKALVDFKEIASEDLRYSSIEESVAVTGNGSTLKSTSNNAYAKVII